MELNKITVYANDRAAARFAMDCAFDIIDSNHKSAGYSNGHFFASARRTKSGAVVRVTDT